VTTGFVCIAVAFALTWVPRLVVRMRTQGEGEPAPWVRRLASTEQDAERLFAPFAAGVFVAHLAGLDPRRAGVLAVAHVATRLVYPWLHAASIDYLASAVWAVGLAAVAALYLLPGLAGLAGLAG
jgi:uncharacterized MAPEG superfamily protein